jgi:type I restriction-modification system DNA methylase subunit
MNAHLNALFRKLDMDSSNGLVSIENKQLTGFQKHFYDNVKEKLGVDAVYFLRVNGEAPKVPVVYFSLIEKYDADIIAELHKMAWNLGEAPLLFVVTPEALLIYNNYHIPEYKNNKLDPEAALIERLFFANELEFERQLAHYQRLNLESGVYWRENESRFKIENRVDSVLIRNLKFMRNELVKHVKSSSAVHCLLGRAILIKYLEDRKDSTGNAAFPHGFYEQFYKDAQKFTDVLQSKDATYKLFEFFQNKFNGDMFPIFHEELQNVQEQDVALLRDFLIGNIDFEICQYNLWSLYTFNLIPIQLISTIYEMLFQLELEDDCKKQRHGTYYTPYHLVEMLMDEVYPWDGEYNDQFKILDPACGSGVFLVEAYRRTISRWMTSYDRTNISAEELQQLIKKHIYGVDFNEEAIRIAAFSLSLVLCDYLEPLNIWNTLTFPSLRNQNLFISDFFDEDQTFNQYKYDIVIGNPPWESILSEKAARYLKESKLVVGDKQISQAFTWKAADCCKNDGWICLLMPSKGFLFNLSSTNLEYRRKFFKHNNVVTLINFTGYKTQLFQNAKSPATAIFYQKDRNSTDERTVLYCTPKPTYTIEDRRQFIIEPLDVCKIPLDLVENQFVWKICMFGGPRDLELINKINLLYKTISEFTDDKVVVAEGFKLGNRKKKYDFMKGKLLVNVTRDLKPFTIDKNKLKTNENEMFERIAIKNLDIFKVPHLLIGQSPRKGRLVSALLDYEAIFNHSILGMQGDENYLKYICILLSSKVFSYYALMTSGRWIIERSELEAEEIKRFPIPEYNTNMQTDIDRIFEIVKKRPDDLNIIDEYAYQLYQLHDYEKHLINDALEFILGYNMSDSRKQTMQKCNLDNIKIYENTLLDVLKNTFGDNKKFSTQIFIGDMPLVVTKITLETEQDLTNVIITEKIELRNILQKLDELLVTKYAQGLYVRRNITIFEGKSIYLVKPNQLRYWTYSSACRDVDDIYAQIMRSWRGVQ